MGRTYARHDRRRDCSSQDELQTLPDRVLALSKSWRDIAAIGTILAVAVWLAGQGWTRAIGGGDNTFAYPYMIQTRDGKIHVIYTTNERHCQSALNSQRRFQASLLAQGYPEITTDIGTNGGFYYAEHYHQQYLAKVPNGYCGLGGTGVCYAD